MNILEDIITYVRRIIKTPSNSVITDNLIVDYINRFWLLDLDARVQLYDLKTKYTFLTSPGVDQYNMPLYDLQTQSSPGNFVISSFPVYQNFLPPARVNGINVPFYNARDAFFNLWPNYVNNVQGVIQGNGSSGPYSFIIPFGTGSTTTVNQQPSGILRGHVDINGIISAGLNSNDDPIVAMTFNPNVLVTSVYSAVYISSTNAAGQNVVVADSGQFLSSNVNCGLLMAPGTAPFGNTALTNPADPSMPYSLTSNVVNYTTGECYVNFPDDIPAGQNINVQAYLIQPGLPRALMYYNNIITLRNPPDTQYQVEMDCYLTPAAFLSTSQALPFAYMGEYIARGAARKILADTGDIDQLQLNEKFFIEQELLVWKRSQRQITATRTQTLYSGFGFGNDSSSNGLYGSGAT